VTRLKLLKHKSPRRDIVLKHKRPIRVSIELRALPLLGESTDGSLARLGSSIPPRDHSMALPRQGHFFVPADRALAARRAPVDD
jgi:hypothetical protein